MPLPDQPAIIRITPHTRGHGVEFSALGVVIFAVTMFLWLIDAALPTAAYALLYITSAGLFLLGSAKLFEPEVSMELSPEAIRYLHPRGSWQVSWTQVVRFDVPRVHRGLELESLPYVGLRLYDVEPLLQQITPRLAVYLLSEQRHLLVTALRHERPELQDYSSYFEVPDRYRAASGVEYRGVQAMFAVRCEHFRELLGYDLLISATALDRPPEEFALWLQQLKDTRFLCKH